MNTAKIVRIANEIEDTKNLSKRLSGHVVSIQTKNFINSFEHQLNSELTSRIKDAVDQYILDMETMLINETKEAIKAGPLNS